MARKSKKTPFFIQLDGAPWFNKERLRTALTNENHPPVVTHSQRLDFRLLTLFFETEEDRQRALLFWEKRNAYVIAGEANQRPNHSAQDETTAKSQDDAKTTAKTEEP